MSGVRIVGAANTRFGSFVKRDKQTGAVQDQRSIYELLLEAGRAALADARVSGADVDGVWVGSCAPGLFANQEHLAAVAPEIDPAGLRFKPMTRCEDACASGSVALYNAMYAVEAGRARVALVIGVEKMCLLDTEGVTHALATCSSWLDEGARGISFPCLFAEYAKGYAARWGIGPDRLARMHAAVAALAYRNGVDNPLAHFGRGGPAERLGLFTPEAILALPEERNPLIAEPLRLHDCSLISDGAAAVLIMSADAAAGRGGPEVDIAGIGHVNERLAIAARANLHELAGAREAARRAYAEAGVGPDDVDAAEVHDCFTITALLCAEALGLSAEGRAGEEYLAGRFGRDDPTCSINLSGGLKAKGHPVGATGVSMHALLYKQLTGSPIGAAPDRGAPEVGVTMNIGGSGATNCVTVLRRRR